MLIATKPVILIFQIKGNDEPLKILMIYLSKLLNNEI